MCNRGGFFFPFSKDLLKMDFEPYVRTWALGNTCEEVSLNNDCLLIDITTHKPKSYRPYGTDNMLFSSFPHPPEIKYLEGNLKVVNVKITII